MKPKPLDLEEMKWKQPVSEKAKFQNWLIDEVKQRIKSACEFYLKYKDDPPLFWDEQKEYRKLLKKDLGHIIIRWETMKRFRDSRDKYNDWLFRLAFRSVLKEDNE